MAVPSHRSSVRVLSLFVVAMLTATLLAQGAPSGTLSTEPPGEGKADPVQAAVSPKLNPGDMVEISVFGVPDLATKGRINNSGDIYLPLVDYVHIADLTSEEAQTVIEKRLDDGGYVRNPHVAVFVSESSSQTVTVLGEVNRPGSYPAIGQRRLFDLISAAGGLTERAGRNISIAHRDKPDQKETLHLAYNLAEDLEHNVAVRPGDTIVVSRAGIVYVVGDVARPSGFSIEDDSLTVLKALALAGGQTRTSSLNGARILRQTPSGVKEIPVHLKKVIHAKAPDVALVRGDVLFIPGSATKTFAYRGVDAAMSMTSTLAVIAVRP